jgi:hypothetical protein
LTPNHRPGILGPRKRKFLSFVQTIEGHLAFWVKKGDLAINGLVAADKQRDIEEKIAEMSQTSLKALKTALGDAYSYGGINLVLAHLQHSATP